MGHYFIIALIIYGCAVAIARPALGCVLFYFVALLDPVWNWRWALPPDAAFQKWIFFSVVIGAIFNLGSRALRSATAVYTVGAFALFLLITWLSWQQSPYHTAGALYMGIIWKVALMAAVSIWLLNDRRYLHLLLIACIIGSTYNAYQINLDYFETGVMRWVYRLYGSNNLDNNTYSLLTLPVMAMSLGGVLGFRRWYLVYGCLFAFALQAHQFMLVESRGAMLAAVVLAAVGVFFMPRTKKNLRVVVIGAVLISLLAGPPVVKEFTSAFKPTDELDSSAASRFRLWSAGARIMADYPLLGVGPYVSRYYVPIYYEGGLNQELKALHNLFFEVGSEVGVAGLIAYLAYFCIPYWAVFRNRKRYLDAGPTECAATLAVLCGVPSYFVGSMFSAGTLIESCYLLPVIACVLVRLDTDGALGEAAYEDDSQLDDSEIDDYESHQHAHAAEA